MPMNIVVWVASPGRDASPQRASLPATIGRSPDCEVLVDDSQVSGEHARLDESDGVITVTDLDSANGTRLAGRPVHSERWDLQGSITVGGTVVTLLHTGPTTTRIVTCHSADSRPKRQVLRLPCTLDGPDGNVIVVDAIGDDLRAATVTDPAKPLQWKYSGAHGQLRIAGLQLESLSSQEASLAPTELQFDASGQPVPSQHAEPVDSAFPPESFTDADTLSLATLQALGVPVVESEFLALGGGLGSFCWVDALRVRGVSANRIAVVGFESVPYARYKRLCQNSQIPDHERLRSNSESCPDNVWGFPGYALRESWKGFTRGRWISSAATAWQVVAEPDYSPTYTPRAGDVFDSVDVEAKRIGWDRMMSRGRIRTLRRLDDGRYAVAVSSRADATHANAIYVGKNVHIALGYPGLQFLPDLRKYREDTLDFQHVVNAYEDHDHVYDSLNESGGTVILRGRGIVASRVLQRIYEARQKGADIRVIHLMRTPNTQGNRAGEAKRHVENHWEFQPFNWPEACWGGDLERQLVHASDDARQQLIRSWGGTTTADRNDWRDIVNQGLKRGWYRIVFGTVQDIQQDSGRLTVQVVSPEEEAASLTATYIIDATGLVASPQSNPFWADLIERYGLALNAAGRVAVTPQFRVEGLGRRGNGVYAAGVATLGGPYAPVDSFLGLQYAAQASLQRTAGVPNFGPGRSIAGWLRWVKGVAP
jgi:pSer/pThr/pTyr-binding forkhead associated (FHA) protein